MKLGAFSISLPVRDLAVSRAFYAKLGFEEFAGDAEHGYLILRNPDGHIVGLFRGMFDRPMLTFNPGWDQSAKDIAGFDDVRDVHEHLTGQGVTAEQVTLDPAGGPGSFVVIDPDGNPILIDQHR